MKNIFLAATLGLTLLTSPALAQSHPLRSTFGGARTFATPPNVNSAENSNFVSSLVGVSVDVKTISPQRMLSFYADSSYTTGDIKREYGGCQSFGLSIRQSSPKNNTWVGLGGGFYDVGSYDTPFRDREYYRHIRGIGGKIFLGTGYGLIFTEAALHLPSATQYVQGSLSVGIRL